MRSQLIHDIKTYSASDEEACFISPMIELMETKEDAFYRTCFTPGHITGSGLLVNPDTNSILLNHHKTLDRWLCFGGHADGDEDIRRVAFRETCEESGYSENQIEFYTQEIFDLDIHTIPENKKRNEPEHNHLDIAFLFRLKETTPTEFFVSHESNALKWCSINEAVDLTNNDLHMLRMIDKLKTLKK